jgi:hypothetical protein
LQPLRNCPPCAALLICRVMIRWRMILTMSVLKITCLFDMDIPRPDNFNETYLYEGMLILHPLCSATIRHARRKLSRLSDGGIES